METILITLDKSEEITVKCVPLRRMRLFEETITMINFQTGVVLICLNMTNLIEVQIIRPNIQETFEATYFLHNLKDILYPTVISQKTINKIKEIIKNNMVYSRWPYNTINLKRSMDEHS